MWSQSESGREITWGVLRLSSFLRESCLHTFEGNGNGDEDPARTGEAYLKRGRYGVQAVPDSGLLFLFRIKILCCVHAFEDIEIWGSHHMRVSLLRMYRFFHAFLSL